MTRRKLVGVLALTIVLAVALSPRSRALYTFPAELRVVEGDLEELRLDLPLALYARCDREGLLDLNGQALGSQTRRVSLASPLLLKPLATGRASLEFWLFDLFPLKRVVVDVLPQVKLVPGGQSIGVLLQPGGVLVVGLTTVIDAAGVEHSPARSAGLEVGDLIVRLAGETTTSDEQISAIVNREAQAGRPVVVEVRRDGTARSFTVWPALCRETGQHRLGILARDMTAGVGTLTFYHPETLVYAALGHVIADAETAQPVDVHSGRIVQAYVAQVEPGRRGEPGEKLGSFSAGVNVLGDIQKNGACGIFGRLDRLPSGGLYADPLPLALSRQVHTGPAEIVTVLEGNTLERFAVEIVRVQRQSRPAAKGLVIQVTDPRLLSRTGGIVQGMSGSPIIQDGRIAGAVTHVFVNDPSRGYGMFAEWMALEAAAIPGRAPTALRLPANVRAAWVPERAR